MPAADGRDMGPAPIAPAPDDELRRAMAQRGLMALSGAAQPAPMAGPTSQPATQGTQGTPIPAIVPPQSTARGIAPIPGEQQANLSELNRLTNPSLATSGSGISQIGGPHPSTGAKIARGILGTIDTLGTMFAPRFGAAIPGTQLHHQQLVNQAQGRVAEGEKEAAAETAQNEGAARVGLQNSQAKEADAGIPLKAAQTEAEKALATGRTGTETRAAAAAPGEEDERKARTRNFNAEAAGRENPTVKGEVVQRQIDGKPHSVLINPNTGADIKDLGETGEKAVPPRAGHVVQREINGKPHSVLVDAATGEDIKDLGETGEKPPAPPVVNVGNQDFQRAEHGRGLLDAAEKQYRGANQSANALGDFVQSAKSGNKVVGQALPLEGALTITTAQGVHRINRNEIDQIQGAGSLFDKIMGKAGKWVAGQPVPADLLKDYESLGKLLQQEAYKTYKEAHDSAVKRYGLTGEEPLPDPGARGAATAPVIQHSPSTGQYRYSTDGGKTWQPGQPPK